MMGAQHLGLGPSPAYTDTHGIPLLATDAVSGERRPQPACLCRRRRARPPARQPHTPSRCDPSICPPPSCPACLPDMEKKGLRDQLEAQAREIARLQGEAPRCLN